MSKLDILRYQTDQDGVRIFLTEENYMDMTWEELKRFKFLDMSGLDDKA